MNEVLSKTRSNFRYGRKSLCEILYNYCEFEDVEEDCILGFNNRIDIDCQHAMFKRTPLMCASTHCNIKDVKILLDMGANINLQDTFGNTALISAVKASFMKRKTQERVVRQLLSVEGIDVNIRNKRGLSAMTFANSPEIMKMLLDIGANINNQDRDGDSILTSSVQNGEKDVVEFLLKSNVDVDAQNNSGKTALMIAIDEEYTDIVKMLLESRADVNLQDNGQWTALHYASHHGSEDAVELLLKYSTNKVDINILNNERGTASMLATKNVKKILEDY